jgi:hypothetical protein
MMKIKFSRNKEIINTSNLEIIAKILMRNLKRAMKKRLLIDKLRIITREIVKIEVNMITEITEITVTTETTTEVITETVVTTTEDTIIMTEMIEMTDNLTEDTIIMTEMTDNITITEEEEMTIIMTTMIEKNTEIASLEKKETETKDLRDLTNLSMMIIRKMFKKKKKLIKHHN